MAQRTIPSNPPSPSMANQISNFINGPLFTVAFRLIALALIDVFAIWFIFELLGNDAFILALFVGVVTIGINAIFLMPTLYAYRWFAPGLTLMIIVIIYPTIFTVYAAFTNYRTGNFLTQAQAQQVFEARTYLPEDAPTYSWTAFRATDNPDNYALWLIPDSDDAEARDPFLALENSIVPGDEVDLGDNTLDEDGVPTGIVGYERLSRGQAIPILDSVLNQIEFGDPENVVKLSPTRPLDQAGIFRDRYIFNDDGTLIDNATGVVYTAETGTFTSREGEELRPGYYVYVGAENFERLLTSERIRGPFAQVFLWTITFAFLSVLLTFWFGLFLAVVLNADFMPGRAVWRTLLLVPYAIPAFVTVLIWKGLLNEQLGVVNDVMRDVFAWAPPWFSDPTWAKIGIMVIQLWLGFPYMMLICSGALQSIPRDIYAAAEVDGASVFQKFRFLTLPLLLVAVGPLLIASFAFNFNNFTIIELYNRGEPVINLDTPAGHTDILITYMYDIAFGGGGNQDYALASAVTLVIFLMVAIITIFNFRFTRGWEEISENV